jgi:hypothetical protein
VYSEIPTRRSACHWIGQQPRSPSNRPYRDYTARCRFRTPNVSGLAEIQRLTRFYCLGECRSEWPKVPVDRKGVPHTYGERLSSCE